MRRPARKENIDHRLLRSPHARLRFGHQQLRKRQPAHAQPPNGQKATAINPIAKTTAPIGLAENGEHGFVLVQQAGTPGGRNFLDRIVSKRSYRFNQIIHVMT